MHGATVKILCSQFRYVTIRLFLQTIYRFCCSQEHTWIQISLP